MAPTTSHSLGTGFWPCEAHLLTNKTRKRNVLTKERERNGAGKSGDRAVMKPLSTTLYLEANRIFITICQIQSSLTSSNWTLHSPRYPDEKTRSLTTAVPEEWYQRYKNNLIKCPMLPVTNTFILGVTGNKSAQLKKQIWVTIHHKGSNFEMTVAVVSGLICDFILGVNTLKRAMARIDLEEDTLIL